MRFDASDWVLQELRCSCSMAQCPKQHFSDGGISRPDMTAHFLTAHPQCKCKWMGKNRCGVSSWGPLSLPAPHHLPSLWLSIQGGLDGSFQQKLCFWQRKYTTLWAPRECPCGHNACPIQSCTLGPKNATCQPEVSRQDIAWYYP